MSDLTVSGAVCVAWQHMQKDIENSYGYADINLTVVSRLHHWERDPQGIFSASRIRHSASACGGIVNMSRSVSVRGDGIEVEASAPLHQPPGQRHGELAIVGDLTGRRAERAAAVHAERRLQLLLRHALLELERGARGIADQGAEQRALSSEHRALALGRRSKRTSMRMGDRGVSGGMWGPTCFSLFTCIDARRLSEEAGDEGVGGAAAASAKVAASGRPVAAPGGVLIAALRRSADLAQRERKLVAPKRNEADDPTRRA